MLALVTGGTGFVGRAVCERFLAGGWRVRTLARSEGGHAGGEHVTLDLERDDPHAALAGADAVIHLAGRAHVLRDRAAGRAELYRRANVTATGRLARAAKESGVARFVFVSTAKVQGESSPGRPYTESDPPAPQDDYALSKWEAELAIRHSGVQGVIVRPPLVYGPGVGANFLRLVRLVETGLPLPFASVENLRSLVFVRNLADCLFTCATHRAAAGRTYLVSDGEDVSTPQLMRLLAQALARPARLVPCPVSLLRAAATLAGRGDEAGRLLDSMQVEGSRIARELGWRVPYSLPEGLRATAQWFRSAKSASR